MGFEEEAWLYIGEWKAGTGEQIIIIILKKLILIVKDLFVFFSSML
jgi:hypothetical protein